MQATLEELHRQLSEAPSPARRAESDLPLDARRIADWVSALPRANLQAVQSKLINGLAALVSRSMDGAARLAVLEQLRVPALEVAAQLEGQFVGAGFPLAPAKLAVIEDLQDLHHLLAEGYRLAAAQMCAPSGKVPMLRGGSVAQALVRAIGHYGNALRTAWLAYRKPAPGNWLGLHRCASFAASAKLETKRVDDELSDRETTAVAAYLCSLIVATAGPHAQTQATQGDLWALAHAYAEHCRLMPLVPESGRPIVLSHEDLAPDPHHPTGKASLELDVSALLNVLQSAMDKQPGEMVAVAISRKESLHFSRDALQRLRRALKPAADRAHRRMPGGHALDSVTGLSGLHHHLAGGRGFDAFLRRAREQQIVMTDRAAWAHAGSEAGARRIEASILDQSLGGYRLRWTGDARARVGELVGLCLPAGETAAGGEDWMVGVIRWLRCDADGSVRAGVELLSRRSRAAALIAAPQRGAAAIPLRAIEIDRLDGIRPGGFLSNPRIEEIEGEIEILRMPAVDGGMPPTDTIASPARLRIVQNPGEYALLAAQSPDSE